MRRGDGGKAVCKKGMGGTTDSERVMTPLHIGKDREICEVNTERYRDSCYLIIHCPGWRKKNRQEDQQSSHFISPLVFMTPRCIAPSALHFPEFTCPSNQSSVLGSH